jgi:hypothetical protein
LVLIGLKNKFKLISDELIEEFYENVAGEEVRRLVEDSLLFVYDLLKYSMKE